MYIASGGSDINEESNPKKYYVLIWLYVLVNQNSTFPFIVENILSFNCKYCSWISKLSWVICLEKCDSSL